MNTKQLFQLFIIVAALLIFGLILLVTRVRRGESWAVILKKHERLSRYSLAAAFGLFLLLFVIFFIVNNGFLR